MSSPARRRATYQDVLDAPPEKIAEVINGELYLSQPRYKHASVAKGLLVWLATPFEYGVDGPGGWVFLPEPELHLGEDILVPDLAAWRWERMPMIDDVPFETLVPDWVCEVLSPSTERRDRRDKMSIYASAGVSHAWLVHPIRRTAEVFRRHGRKWRAIAIHQDDQRVHAEPFEAIELDLSKVWRSLTPSPPRADRVCEPTAIYRPGRSPDAYGNAEDSEA